MHPHTSSRSGRIFRERNRLLVPVVNVLFGLDPGQLVGHEVFREFGIRIEDGHRLKVIRLSGCQVSGCQVVSCCWHSRRGGEAAEAGAG